MAYTPTNWKNGDRITAEKLNKIENGIQSSDRGLFVELFPAEVNGTTYQRIIVENSGSEEVLFNPYIVPEDISIADIVGFTSFDEDEGEFSREYISHYSFRTVYGRSADQVPATDISIEGSAEIAVVTVSNEDGYRTICLFPPSTTFVTGSGGGK